MGTRNSKAKKKQGRREKAAAQSCISSRKSYVAVIDSSSFPRLCLNESHARLVWYGTVCGFIAFFSSFPSPSPSPSASASALPLHCVHRRPTHGLAPQFQAVASLPSPPRLFFLPPSRVCDAAASCPGKARTRQLGTGGVGSSRYGRPAVLPVAMPAGRVF